MRTRSAFAYFPYGETVNFHIPNPVVSEVSDITDVNNGKTRPESPCDHVKCVTTRPDEPLLTIGAERSHAYRNAWVFSEYARALVYNERAKHEKNLQAYIEQQLIGLTKRYSSINFFAELADVSSLIKSLDRYRYIDYQFGISPMIGDIKNISNGLTASIDKINSRLDSYSEPTAVNRHYNSSFPLTGATAVDYYTSGLLSGQLTIKSKFTGYFSVSLPILSRYNRDYMIWLDNIGFHPDLSTVYEAIPFSWFIDWFAPIGKSLESMSGNSWLNPQIQFSGSFSTKYYFSGSVTTNDFGSVHMDLRHFLPGQLVQTFDGNGYIRTPLSQNVLGGKRPELTLGLGLDSLGKATLLSDIFGPTKAPEKNSSSREKFVRAYDKLSIPFQRGQQIRLRKS